MSPRRTDLVLYLTIKHGCVTVGQRGPHVAKSGSVVQPQPIIGCSFPTTTTTTNQRPTTAVVEHDHHLPHEPGEYLPLRRRHHRALRPRHVDDTDINHAPHVASTTPCHVDDDIVEPYAHATSTTPTSTTPPTSRRRPPRRDEDDHVNDMDMDPTPPTSRRRRRQPPHVVSTTTTTTTSVGGHDLLACCADDDDLHHLTCRVDRNHDHATSTTRPQPLRVDLATSITTTSTTIPHADHAKSTTTMHLYMLLSCMKHGQLPNRLIHAYG